MAQKSLGRSDRSVLSFRPKIEYVEPDFEGGMPPGQPVGPSTEEIVDKWEKLDNVAKAVGLLAEAAQMMVDEKVGDFYIQLDPVYDRHIIDALQRRFPDAANPNQISYAQYRECRAALSDAGSAFADGIKVDMDRIKGIRKDPMSQKNAVGFDFSSPAAKYGMLRPELQAENMPVTAPGPEDEEKLWEKLANKLWKNYIRPIFTPLPVVGPLIPEEIV